MMTRKLEQTFSLRSSILCSPLSFFWQKENSTQQRAIRSPRRTGKMAKKIISE
jgi:hypothetical protein